MDHTAPGNAALHRAGALPRLFLPAKGKAPCTSPPATLPRPTSARPMTAGPSPVLPRSSRGAYGRAGLWPDPGRSAGPYPACQPSRAPGAGPRSRDARKSWCMAPVSCVRLNGHAETIMNVPFVYAEVWNSPSVATGDRVRRAPAEAIAGTRGQKCRKAYCTGPRASACWYSPCTRGTFCCRR